MGWLEAASRPVQDMAKRAAAPFSSPYHYCGPRHIHALGRSESSSAACTPAPRPRTCTRTSRSARPRSRAQELGWVRRRLATHLPALRHEGFRGSPEHFQKHWDVIGDLPHACAQVEGLLAMNEAYLAEIATLERQVGWAQQQLCQRSDRDAAGEAVAAHARALLQCAHFGHECRRQQWSPVTFLVPERV